MWPALVIALIAGKNIHVDSLFSLDCFAPQRTPSHTLEHWEHLILVMRVAQVEATGSHVVEAEATGQHIAWKRSRKEEVRRRNQHQGGN
jgi:hypothetical protein